jgi:hypothetical protein
MPVPVTRVNLPEQKIAGAGSPGRVWELSIDDKNADGGEQHACHGAVAART